MTFTKFTNGTVADADQVNDNFNMVLKSQMTNMVRALQDRAIDFSGDGSETGEAYTDSTGRLNTVDTGTTTSTFDTDSYERINYNTQGSSLGQEDSTEVSKSSGTWADDKTINYSPALDIYEVNQDIKVTSLGSYGCRCRLVFTYSDDSTATSGEITTNSSDYVTKVITNANFGVKNVKKIVVQLASTNWDGQTIYAKTTEVTGVTINTETSIVHDLPYGIKNSSSSFLTPLFNNWEEGCDVQYKLGLEEKIFTGTLESVDDDFYSWVDTSNVQNLDLNSYASTGIGVTSTTAASIGYTFSAKTIKNVFIKYYNSLSTTVTTLQTYDGSTWTDVETLTSGVGTFTVVKSVDSSVEGVRITFKNSASGSPTAKLYSLSYSTSVAETSYFNYNELSSFSGVTGFPSTLTIKLIPKTTSPTSGYPSIKGYGLRLE